MGRSLFQRLPTKVWEVAVEDAMHRVQLEALPAVGWQRSWHRHADGCARLRLLVCLLRRRGELAHVLALARRAPIADHRVLARAVRVEADRRHVGHRFNSQSWCGVWVREVVN